MQSTPAMSEAASVTSSMNASSVQASESGVQSSPVSTRLSHPESGQAVMALNTLAPHQAARVVDLVASPDGDGAGDDSLLLRLMEIGFLPGESVRIVATGFPGPDPLAVRIGQATFALRSHEAALVLVQLEEAA